MRYFKAKKFNWLGLSKQPSLTAKVRRVAGQILPWSFDDFDWRLTSGASTDAANLLMATRMTPRPQGPSASCCVWCRCWS